MVKLIKETIDNSYESIQDDCEELLGELIVPKIDKFLESLSEDLDDFANILSSKVPGYNPEWCAEDITNFTLPNQWCADQIADVLIAYIMSDLFYNKDISMWKKHIKFNL